ncbi:hypothetical protein UFOVP53_68 [uncultured Caudovirales phage]|uniref:Major tropism determinant N-terminal domain-containing protein n=1 Tax=uncultured Caudovirales phage TaxID=2100421 RepID=A0A6J5KVE3_9CAUD|nr:hypothetical protein UFOVP53_68 [uncultured Caudovirales phage]
MSQQIQFRRDTTANWTATNPILAQGELGLDLTLNRFKIGDGTTHWNLLTFTSSIDATSLKIANDLSDLNNTTTARSNLGLGTAAVANSGDFDAAGTAASEVATHVGLSDPHTQYLKETDNLLVRPEIVTVKVSNAGLGQFSELSLAIASITDADPVIKPYIIEMGAGIHTINNPVTLPSGVSIKGTSINATTLVPLYANQHVLVLSNMCEVSFLNLKGISGSIGSGKAAIYCENTGDFTQLHKLSIYDFDIGIDNYANTTDSILYSEYCDINGNFSYGVKNRSNSTYIAKLQLENFYTYISAGTNPIHVNTAGTNSELILNSSALVGGSGNKGIVIQNGGALLASDVVVKNFSGTGIGLYNANTGSGSDIDIGGAQFMDNNIDMSIQNPGSVASITVTADPTKILITTGANVAAQITDSTYGGLVTIGDIRQGQSFNSLTPISTFITKTGTTGVYTGGLVTAGTGLSIVVAAGEGFCYDVTNDYVAQVTWGITTLSGLSANTTYWVSVDSAGTVSTQTSDPGLINKIYLSKVRTSASSMLWIGKAIMDSSHHGNAIETFARNMGSIYISGSIVTENGTRGLNVSAGRYQYGTTLVNPSGGTPISWTSTYSDGSTGHTFVSGQTQISNSVYDNGSGTLASMTAGYYRKDALYTSGEGANEKLFLVIGQAEYSTLLLAEGAGLPIPPDFFSGTICLIATTIQQQGATHIQEIKSERPTLAFQASGVSAASVHGNLTGLSADDHTQYLLVNGTRAMSGNLAMGTNNITGVGTVDGVTVSAHASRHLPNGADPLTTGVPSTIAGTNATGTANAFARQDHVHAHGSQTDGTHHAAVTTSVNGFMSAADKTKLDLVSSTELGYVAGVTSAIQTQINGKAAPLLWSANTVSNGTLTLTSASNKGQIFTGATGGQIVKLPVATTLSIGDTFYIVNKSDPLIQIVDATPNFQTILLPTKEVKIVLVDNTTSAGIWSISSFALDYGQVKLFDDFVTASAATLTFGALGWTLTTGTLTTQTATGNSFGVARMATAAAANSLCAISLGTTTPTLINNSITFIEQRVSFPAIGGTGANQFAFHGGLLNATTAVAPGTNPLNAIGFSYQGNAVTAGNIFGFSSSATLTTTVDSGVQVVAGIWYKLSMVINAAGTQAYYYVNNAYVGTSSTNMPTAIVTAPQMKVSAGATNAAAKNVDIDFYEISKLFTNSR